MIEYVSRTDEIDALIDAGADIIVCISGGKDSRFVAEAVCAYARARRHRGRIRFVYADLNTEENLVTWADSLDQCRALAARLGGELIVVAREKGGLMERLEQRARDNRARYCKLLMVTALLPFPQPGMGRFCTSELKTGPIQRWVRHNYSEPVVCVLGIRRDEGNANCADGKVIKRDSGRSKAPVAVYYDGVKKTGLPRGSYDWNAVVDVKTDVVLDWILSATDTPSSYLFGAKRYSCSSCIFSTLDDLLAALRDPRNHPAAVSLCRLELDNAFSYQGDRWLSDVLAGAGVLPADLVARIPDAKRRAAERAEVERAVPKHLLFKNDGGLHGWPTTQPNYYEATVLAWVRRRVGEIQGWGEIEYTEPREVYDRYAELIEEKAARDARRRPKKKAEPAVLPAPAPQMSLFC